MKVKGRLIRGRRIGQALPGNVKVGKPSDMAMAEDWAMHTLYWQPTHTQAPDTLQRRPSQVYIVLFTLYAPS